MALTHSTLSVLLRQLEGKVGFKLFERTTRSVSPTPAADLLIEVAERLVDEVEGLPLALHHQMATQRSEIRIAVTPIFAQTILPSVLHAFGREHPGVVVIVDDCPPARFLKTVLDEKIDFGVGSPSHVPRGLTSLTLFRDHLSIVSDRHLAPRARQVAWKSLHQANVITLSDGFGFRAGIEAVAATVGIELSFRHEVSLVSTALAMTAQGLGVMLVPASITTFSNHADVVARQLVRPSVRRDVQLVYRRGYKLAPAASNFCRMLGNACTAAAAEKDTVHLR